MCRQERFINRWIDALSDPRLTHEIKAIWLSYWSQVSNSSSILKLIYTFNHIYYAYSLKKIACSF